VSPDQAYWDSGNHALEVGRGDVTADVKNLETHHLSSFVEIDYESRPEFFRFDSGLIFQSRRFRAAMKDYCLRQEFITPYTPEQSGMIERFFRSLKEERV